MAVDTPAVIAIVGGGPIGLEAALYARFLGYDVRLYERARIVEQLQTAMPLPESPRLAWIASTSPLGIAAIAAQSPEWQPPTVDALLAPGELATVYFLPLAGTDLLVDSILCGTEVVAIERDVNPGDEPPADDELIGFRLHIRDAAGERTETADVLIDASGAAAAPFGFDATEPDFYVLGAKRLAITTDASVSNRTTSSFSFVDGLEQIRDLFKIIADRASLDLYSTIGEHY